MTAEIQDFLSKWFNKEKEEGKLVSLVNAGYTDAAREKVMSPRNRQR